MNTPYKVTVKLGAYEFNAEGPKDDVRADLAAFQETVRILGSAGSRPAGGSSTRQEEPLGGNGAGNGETPRQGVIEITSEIMNRVFVVDTDGQVSLRVLPRSQQREADGLIAILYGFRILQNQQDVLSGRLLAAAQTSGLSVDRIDRALAANMEFVTKGGLKSGSRWGLHNRGMRRAQEIIQAMVN